MTLKNGSKGKEVKLVQEWLCLHGFSVVIDGSFGPATEEAVKKFQRRFGLDDNGAVANADMAALEAPLVNAMTKIQPSTTLGLTVVAVAKQHLREHPREVGGDNMGPWVRHYMDGNEGKAWAWCAGFVKSVIMQACAAHKIAYMLPKTFSCDVLAQKATRLISQPDGPVADLRPGAVFLIRKTPTDWIHTGLVTNFSATTITTIEGNTNEAGSREGIEVRARIRSYKNMDFIPIG